MKSKGFTLIELLAVIVILAIIALISTPIVLNIIEDTKNSATVRSAEFYEGAVELALAKSTLDGINVEEGTYDILESGNICLEKEGTTCNKELEVDVSGDIPDSGTITITSGEISDLSFTYDNKVVSKDETGSLVIGGSSEDTNQNIIEFKISLYSEFNGIKEFTYTALENQTWEEWIDSEFYVTNFENEELNIQISPYNNIDVIFIYRSLMKTDYWVNIEYVKGTDYIIPDHTYFNPYPAECVFPDSEIQVSIEGDTVLAKDLKEGNDIAYYNFETEEVEIGTVKKAYIHEKATNFVTYEFDDGTYVEVTDYHPIYTKEGWKSMTEKNDYAKPVIGDEVKTTDGWKKLTNIEIWEGIEDCYDFAVISNDGEIIDNYFANSTLVQSSY